MKDRTSDLTVILWKDPSRDLLTTWNFWKRKG